MSPWTGTAGVFTFAAAVALYQGSMRLVSDHTTSGYLLVWAGALVLAVTMYLMGRGAYRRENLPHLDRLCSDLEAAVRDAGDVPPEVRDALRALRFAINHVEV
jgi:hypothetical protein